MNEKYKMNKDKIIRLFMLIAAIFINIKYIFVDFGIDAEFQISMSYRLATGDLMFKEMWEPYQMSTFLCVLFIKIWLQLFHTTTGIVLYMQIVGVLIDGAIACLIYRIIEKNFNCKNTAFAMAWVFFMVSPKDVPLPEYANMQVWFSVLLCISLFVYYKKQKRAMLILAGLCLCGMVLSYPSCLIIFGGVIFLLLYAGKKRELLLFTMTCFLAGALYLCFVFSQISFDDFFIVLENMLSLETSHSAGLGDKMYLYLREFAKIAIVFCIAYGISYGIIKVLNRLKRSEGDRDGCKLLTDVLFFGLITVISAYTILFWQAYSRYHYSLVFLAILIVGMRYAKRLSKDKYYFYLCGLVISLMQFLSTLLLTNLELMASVPYLLLAVIVSFLPIAEAFKSIETDYFKSNIKQIALVCGVLFLMIRNVYIIRPLSGDVCSILQIRGIVKDGPAIGIVSEYMGPYIQNESMKEWEQYIEDGDTIFLIGGGLDSLGYLYANTEIGAPTLVPTPGYNESLLEYWEMNPHKYPDVIIASCWYGTLNSELTEDSWIMRWIEEEYKPQYYIDGKYWRYYFK